MTRLEFAKLAVPIMEEVVKTLDKKGADYSTEKDTFENFKRHYNTMEALKVVKAEAPRMYALEGIMEKVLRLTNLGLREPENESVKDTIIDGIAYFLLYYGMYIEDTSLSLRGNKI